MVSSQEPPKGMDQQDANPNSQKTREKSMKQLILGALGLVLSMVVLLSLMFFVTAWTFQYWQGWIYIGALFLLMTGVILYLIIRDPELLKRRLQFREREKTQKQVIRGSWIFFLATYLLPGFDHRFGWSSVPFWLCIVAEVFVIAGYMLVFRVMKENTYLSRIIEVDKGRQKVITTGPYAIIRHPMYLGNILMYTFTPLALGSYWALIPTIGLIAVIIPRILNEEKVLLADLEGYREYTEKTRYRLLPGIW